MKNRYIKTYGMYGLLEWHGIVKCGAASMKVSFTNGTTTAYGVSPATFVTKSPITQFIIEHSEKFKSGRIKLIAQRELPGDAVDGKDAKPKGDGKDTAGKEIRVSSKAEAIEYLKEHFAEKGYTSIKLRNDAAFESACKSCGVKFVWE